MKQPPSHNPGEKLWDFRVEAWREQAGYRVRITGMRTGQAYESAGHNPLWELIRLVWAQQKQP